MSVLVLGSNAQVVECIRELLSNRGQVPTIASTVKEARELVSTGRFSLSFLDADKVLDEAPDWLGQMLDQLEEDERSWSRSPVAFVGNPDSHLRLPKHLPFVDGTFDPDRLRRVIEALLLRSGSGTEAQSSESHNPILEQVALCTSAEMRGVYEIVQRVAQAKITVLISGETGTGKDLVARALHYFSPRRDAPFIKVNCAALPRDLLESELFGYERGAFTGAHQLKLGKFELADRGTIFLDEIGDLHPALQAKLLHVLEDGTFSRLGGKSAVRVDTCVLAATNQNLEQAVAQQLFRHDLYFRLNVVKIVVPPLRERREEIPNLAAYLVRQHAKTFSRQDFALDPAALQRLKQYDFPGNVRELENVVKRAIVLNDRHLTRISFPPSLQASVANPSATSAPAELSLKDIGRSAALAAERDAIARALDQTGWNRVRAAKLLQISYRALLYKIKDAGLNGDHVGDGSNGGSSA
jgi:two-component system response regulator AtoC